MGMHFLPDKPALIDTLGFEAFTSQIQNALYHAKPPFVFGVLGDWGTGKTSILEQLRKKLDINLNEKAELYIPILFNPWLYENEANIVYPLLYAIKKDYKDRLPIPNIEESFWGKFLTVVSVSTLALADIGLRAATKKLLDDAYSLSDIAEHLKNIQEKPDELNQVLNGWADQVTALHDAFKYLLEAYASDYCKKYSLGEASIKFVILIDDLDRCLPDVSIKLLESIKNYLAVENCIFVMALNPKIVYQGVTLKYQGLRIDGREYLEKILSYSFYVPEPQDARVEEFATARLNELLAEATDRTAYTEHFVAFGKVLCECNFKNPRKIKRILNHYLLFLDKYESDLGRFNMHNIIKLIVLAEYFPSLFKLWTNVKDKDAEQELQAKLAGWGKPSFDIKLFEAKYGISVIEAYEQLTQKNKLLVLQSGVEQSTLAEQAKAVFAISRLP